MYQENFKTACLVRITGNMERIEEAKEFYELCIKKKDLVTVPFVLTLRYPLPHIGLSFQFYKLQRVITNAKESVKFCVFSGGYYLMMGQHTGVKGARGMSTGGYHVDSDIFNLKQGMWVSTDTNNLDVQFAVDGNLGDCRAVVGYLIKKEKYTTKRHRSVIQTNFKTQGIICPKTFKEQWLSMLLSSRRKHWTEYAGEWLESQSLKANLSYKKTPTRLKVTAKSFNRHTYSIIVNDFPIPSSVRKGYGYFNDPEPIGFWSTFVHIKPQEVLMYRKNPQSFAQRIDSRFMSLFNLIEGCKDVVFQKDKVRAHVTMKESLSGARRYQYNGDDIKREDVRKRFEQEIMGVKWGIVKTKKGKMGKTLSAEGQHLLKEGLNGEIMDLEGLFPFHLNVEYEKGKWYIAIAGKRFHVKGGLTAIGRVRTAIKGNARVDPRRYSGEWIDCRDSRIVLKRFSELLSKKDSIWVIKQVKIMGAMMKAIQGN